MAEHYHHQVDYRGRHNWLFHPFPILASFLPTHSPSLSLFRDLSHKQLLLQELQHLFLLGAVELVPERHRGKGFYSHYFLTEKKTGGW